MKIQKAIPIVAGCLLALGAQRAKAVSDITYYLDQSDISGPGTADYGTVEINLVNSTTVDVTFTAASGYVLFWDSHIADLNLASAYSSATGSDFNPSAIQYTAGTWNGGGGLGTFNFLTKDTANPPNGGSLITFTLTDNSGFGSDAAAILALNDSGFLAAAHVALVSNTGTTFFVGSDGATVPPGGGTPPAVPDGGTTVVLLGSTLTGLAFIGRKFRKS